MSKNIYHSIIERINSGNMRSVKAKKNILYSLIIRGLNISLGFLLVPITLHYLNETKYGIWITISAFIEWFNFFDIGLDNGFRNKFAEAIAKGKHELAKIYTSTVYGGMLIVSAILLLFFVGINPFLNWSKIFNAPHEMAYELKVLMIFVFTSFCVRFVLRIIKTIVIADQRPSITYLFMLFGKFISLSIIYLLTKTTEESLLYIGICFSLVPTLVLLVASIYFFTGKYKQYRPVFKFIQFSSLRSMLNLGAKFFVIQIAAIVIFSTDNMIIAHLFGPDQVTPYSIAFKYFNVVTMIVAVVLSPFWSAFTEAWVKKDIIWIKNIIKKLKRIWLLILGGTTFLVFISGFIYKIWVGESIEVPLLLSVVMGVFVVGRAYGAIYVNFLNGVGKVKLQFYSSIFTAIVNIPLSIFLAKSCNLGISGVMVATVISSSFGFIVAPYQYKLIISNKATGIWNK